MAAEKVEVSQQIDARPEVVWALVGNFQSIKDWFPGIAESRAEGEGIGALRHLTLSDVSIISDRLVAQEDGVSYSYEIVAGDVPMTNYSGTVSVAAQGSGCCLSFVGSFEVADELREQTVAFITDIYTAAFKNARKLITG